MVKGARSGVPVGHWTLDGVERGWAVAVADISEELERQRHITCSVRRYLSERHVSRGRVMLAPSSRLGVPPPDRNFMRVPVVPSLIATYPGEEYQARNGPCSRRKVGAAWFQGRWVWRVREWVCWDRVGCGGPVACGAVGHARH